MSQEKNNIQFGLEAQADMPSSECRGLTPAGNSVSKWDGDTVLTDEEKRRAAYALNLCTVSVSQIIDYDDIYILEQEYNSILNNLNLEEMPKDDALLDILKQLLNVITFFRIQEGDKVFIEREYQQRMKDAIWSAVPNPSVILSGGSWTSAAVSLVTQVGIGYMNYRREKARIQQDREKTCWKLQRAAMEQFNGLRRELFDTAWRLADKYKFKDTYRITERQITRYNNILMDPDPLRRYERLNSLAGKFEAYPPFLYFQGNAANMVYQDDKYDPETRSRFRAVACEHFKQFLSQTERNLLREDHILASCALEYFDILTFSAGPGNISAEQAKLEELLDRAIDASGSAFDVLQLCAASYLRIGNTEKAADLLRQLVNEGYNTNVNAQLLSSLYVGQYIRQGDEQARANYQTLRTRVDPKVLFPLPGRMDAGQEELQAEYLQAQQQLLAKKYGAVMTSLLERYTIRFNQIIPAADPGRDYPEYYFDGIDKTRKQDILDLFDDSAAREEYTRRLAGAHIESGIIKVMNEVYAAVCGLPCMAENEAGQKRFYNLIREQIENQQENFEKMLTDLYKGKFDQSSCQGLLDISLFTFAGKAFDALNSGRGIIIKSIKKLHDMSELACVETGLYNFCIKEGIPYPEVEFVPENVLTVPEAPVLLSFDEGLLGKKASRLKQERDKAEDMLECIRSYQKKLLHGHKNSFKLYIQGDKELRNYIKGYKTLKRFKPGDIIAVLDDTSYYDQDIVFTTGGIYSHFQNGLLAMFAKPLKGPVPYENVKYTGNTFSNAAEPELQIGKETFKSKPVDLQNLYQMIYDLAGIERKYRN